MRRIDIRKLRGEYVVKPVEYNFMEYSVTNLETEEDGISIRPLIKPGELTRLFTLMLDFGPKIPIPPLMKDIYIPETADDYYYNTFQDLFNAAFNKLVDYVNIKYGIVIKFTEDDYNIFQDAASELLDIEM